jgi:hypothetical protein
MFVQLLEARTLLSGTPTPVINYLDVDDWTHYAAGTTIDAYAHLPLHVTAVDVPEESLTGTNFNDSTGAIKGVGSL